MSKTANSVDLRDFYGSDQTVSFRGSTVIDVPEGWNVTDASVVTDNPFLQVTSVSYDTPEGADQKELVLRRPAPVVFATRQGEQGTELLVVSQVRHGAGTSVLELPGGMGKKGESPSEIAARECSEEGGVTVNPDDLSLMGTVHRDVARSPGLVAQVFCVEVSADVPTTTPVVEQGEHITGRQWTLLSDLVQQLAAGDLLDSVLQSALGIYLARGAAHS